MAQLKNIIVEGESRLIGDVNANKITASSFVNPNGTSNDFLKADGSLDSNTYITSDYHDSTKQDKLSEGDGTVEIANNQLSVNYGAGLTEEGGELVSSTFVNGTGANSVVQKTTNGDNTAGGTDSFAAGRGSKASGNVSHAEGLGTETQNIAEHAEGQHNKSNKVSSGTAEQKAAGSTIHSVGIGTSENDKKNAFEIMQNGDAYLYGAGGYNGTNPTSASTVQYLLTHSAEVPIMEKTFSPITCAANNQNEAWVYFMNVVPKSDNFYEPWYIRYNLKITTNNTILLGEYDCMIGMGGATCTYSCFNRLGNASYFPSYNHIIATYDSIAKYENRATNPVKIGERIQDSYSAATASRTFEIKVFEIYNCDVAFTSQVELFKNVYTAAKYGVSAQINATANGLQETSDQNTVPHQLYEYYTRYQIHDTNTPLYRYKIFGLDSKRRIVPCNITNQTSDTVIAKTACGVPMVVSNGLRYYMTTTTVTATTVYTPAAVIYQQYTTSDSPRKYNFNETAFPPYTDYYFQGSYNPNTDEFTLDTSTADSYYTTIPISATTGFDTYFTEGKYYWYVGGTGPDTSFNFTISHPLYIFKGGKLIPAQNYENPVFVAQYGATTFDELSRAYNDGKSVFVQMTNWHPSPWNIGRADDGFNGSVPLIEIASGVAHFSTLVFANNGNDASKNGICRIDVICNEGSTWSRDIDETYIYTSPTQSEIDSLFDEPTPPTPGSSTKGDGGYTPGTNEAVFAGFVMGQTQSGAAGEILYGTGTNYNSIKNEDGCTLMDTNGQRLSYITTSSTDDSTYITLSNGGELSIDMYQQSLWEYTD